MSASTDWMAWLLAEMDDHLQEATAEGLPADTSAIGVAHVLHGVQVLGLPGGFPEELVALWLHHLAAAVDQRCALLPVLEWLPDSDDERA